MRRNLAVVAVLFLLFATINSSLAADVEFGDFLQRVNVSAQADLPGFKARLSGEFAVPVPRVEVLLKTLPTPADAYMCLRLGQVSQRPVDDVVAEYQKNRGKGWGVVAKNLGIKPGSKEFHALKEGRFDSPPPRHAEKGDKGKGKGKH